jgi:hypothetical protein|tara:strand:+ start:2822 stop:3496 length:675 start_codon:yes stop_codon:yes gene_type:complete
MSKEVLMKKVYRILLLVTLLFLVISMLDSCEKDVQNKNLLRNISNLDIENQRFKTEIKKNGDKINSQSQIILTQKQAIDNGLIEIDGLKRIKSKVSVVTSTKIDTVFIPYNRVVVDSSSSSPIQYRNYFDYQEPKGWYSISGYSSDFGVGIDSLRVKNDFSIYIADKKVNLFGKSNPEVLLINKNPYTETIQMQNVIITIYQPFYKKNSFWAGVGFVGGYLLAK